MESELNDILRHVMNLHESKSYSCFLPMILFMRDEMVSFILTQWLNITILYLLAISNKEQQFSSSQNISKTMSFTL